VEFNRQHPMHTGPAPRADGQLAASEVVYIPDAHVLEIDHAELIPGLPAPTGGRPGPNSVTGTGLPGAVAGRP
jgi:hypothetical protein